MDISDANYKHNRITKHISDPDFFAVKLHRYSILFSRLNIFSFDQVEIPIIFGVSAGIISTLLSHTSCQCFQFFSRDGNINESTFLSFIQTPSKWRTAVKIWDMT